jgi:hypothetical protein
MKLVRENINEEFKEQSDPIEDMGISADEIFKKIMADAKNADASDRSAIYSELIKYGFFKSKKEAAEMLNPVFKYIQKQSWNDITDIDITWILGKEQDIERAEEIIHYTYLIDPGFVHKLVQILIWKDKEELFNICLKKYGKAFLNAIKETGTHISGVGWRNMPKWYNKILANEVRKTDFFKLKYESIKSEIEEKKEELAKLSKMETQKTFTDEELIDMANYFEQYKKYLSDKKYGLTHKKIL